MERSKELPIPTLDQYQAIYRALPDDLAALAAFAGLRKGETLWLRPQDIDLEARAVRVEGAVQEVTGRGAVLMEPKTASSRRTVALPGLLVEILTDHLLMYVGPDLGSFLLTQQRGAPHSPQYMAPGMGWTHPRRPVSMVCVLVDR